MVSKHDTTAKYTPPPSSVGSDHRAGEEEEESPMITIGASDIRVVLDKDDRYVPLYEKNTYKLERDPCLTGRRAPTNLAFCPHCSKENIRTRTKTYPSTVTWACVAVGAVAFFPICWVPLVVDNMKTTDHYCQNCGQKLATIKPLQGVGTKERF